MKRRIISLALLLVMVFTAIAASGCAGQSSETSWSGNSVPGVAPAPEPMAPPMQDQSDSAKSVSITSEGSASYSDSGVNRVIVRNGNLSIVAEDVLLTRDRIAALAQGLGGWVVTSQVNSSDGDNIWGQITIRVPDDRFDEVVTTIRDYAYEVRSEATNSQDVTEEFIDLSGRLENAKATEERYLALLERSYSVEDTLRVYEYLKRIQDEIEHLTGRIQYLEESAAMSLIYVELQPKRDTALIEDGWRFSEVWRKAVRGLTTFCQWLASAIVWVLIFSPLWGGATAAVIITRRRRRKNRQQTGT